VPQAGRCAPRDRNGRVSLAEYRNHEHGRDNCKSNRPSKTAHARCLELEPFGPNAVADGWSKHRSRYHCDGKTTSSSKRSKSIIRPLGQRFPDIWIGSVVQKLATMRAMSFFVSKPTCRKADNKGCSNECLKKVQ
jgi:hypothetical protein